MDTVYKETTSFTRRTEPPDPTAESRFWHSDESDSEDQSDAAVQNEGKKQHRKSSGKKGKTNTSRQLDGTMESRLGKSKSDKHAGLKQVTHPYRLDKENKPAAVNRSVDTNVQNCAWADVNVDDAMQQADASPGTDSRVYLTNVCMQVPENESPSSTHQVVEGHAKISKTEDLGHVMVNMEYAGDSILASMSSVGDIQELEMGEEEEISSDQSNKSKSFTAINANSSDINHIIMQNLHTENVTSDTIVVLNDWTMLNAKASEFMWKEVWNREEDSECEKLIWNNIVLASKKARLEVNVEEHKQSYESAITLLRKDEIAYPCNFFEKSTTLIESLVEWLGNLLDQERAVGMKRKYAHTQGPTGLMVASKEGQTSMEATHQKKKKNKSSKAKPRQSDGKGENLVEVEKLNDIWSSKNRKPEKNFGSSKEKANKEKHGGMSQKRKIIGEFYKEAAKREDNLMGSVANIISKSGNDTSKFLNSIKNMNSCKLSKFSAKVNDSGEVCIDESMIENEAQEVTAARSEKKRLKKKSKRLKGKDMAGQRIEIILQNLRLRKGGGRPHDHGEGYRNYGMNRQVQQDHSKRIVKDMEKEKGRKITTRGKNTKTNMERTVTGTTKKNLKKPTISVVETTNRYSLLDEDGIEIMDTNETPVGITNEDVIPEELNSEWIKTQESNLDVKYNKQVTTKQRIEAKKYVIDKLVPLRTVLSTWSIFHLEYFRCLCSLYKFGAGYLAVLGDSFLGVGRSIDHSPGQNEDVEEVESERDGTAEFMTEDIHPSPSKNEGVDVLEPIEHNLGKQPDHDMETAEVHSHDY
ncbi:hypothetical protein L1987_14056 [Smallanthus sonchifolius]|uniref:Uncharacterized protein n=1 Tax=Smallanthus sonchifolius TaxID=185202 RepID=A0ACB9JLQ3_9ASTR|nr:hypothetical protein L1987_14056 [Smallanthus sonchifolius]